MQVKAWPPTWGEEWGRRGSGGGRSGGEGVGWPHLHVEALGPEVLVELPEVGVDVVAVPVQGVVLHLQVVPGGRKR